MRRKIKILIEKSLDGCITPQEEEELYAYLDTHYAARKEYELLSRTRDIRIEKTAVPPMSGSDMAGILENIHIRRRWKFRKIVVESAAVVTVIAVLLLAVKSYVFTDQSFARQIQYEQQQEDFFQKYSVDAQPLDDLSVKKWGQTSTIDV